MYSDRALVIGAGFAGLLAARVLSESYGDVVVVERDRISADTRYRPGVPGRTTRTRCWRAGPRSWRRSSPQLGGELEDAGAVRGDVGGDHLIRLPTGWAPRDHLALSVLSVTRVTVERIIRRRVLKLPNVSLVDGVAIDGLLNDRRTVTGVRGTRDDGPFTDYADLVVDASGRGSKLVPWLAEHGVHCPAPVIVNGHVSCTSRLYHVTGGLGLDWKTACEPVQAPGRRHGGALSTVDGSLWFVTLFGADGDAAPVDEDGFAEYAATLETRTSRKSSRPRPPIHRSGTLRSRLNRFHQGPDWPRGLLALGDSVISSNPVHGHGMTLAALNCAALRHLSRDHDLAKEPLLFQRAAAKTAALPWTSVTTADLGWSGRRLPPRTRLRRWYAKRLAGPSPATGGSTGRSSASRRWPTTRWRCRRPRSCDGCSPDRALGPQNGDRHTPRPRVGDHVGRSTGTAAGLPVPHGEQRVGLVDHSLARLHVGARIGRDVRQLHDLARTRQQPVEDGPVVLRQRLAVPRGRQHRDERPARVQHSLREHGVRPVRQARHAHDVAVPRDRGPDHPVDRRLQLGGEAAVSGDGELRRHLRRISRGRGGQLRFRSTIDR